MKVMHLLAAGGTGGIETLCKDYVGKSVHENTFVCIWGKNGKTYLDMKNNGADIIQLCASKRHPFQTLKDIDKICNERKIDIVIAHHAAPLSYLYLLWIKHRKLPIKTIVYAHGNAVDMCHIHIKKGLFLRKFILKYTLRKTDKIFAISYSVKKSLIDYLKAKPEKIEVIYNGVDVDRFRYSNGINRDLHRNIKLIYVGRLIQEKGVQLTLKALSKVSIDLPWSFDIVGDGEYRPLLEKLVNELGISNKVSFMGTRSDIPELYEKADVFIHMPIWEEGFGIALVEAMSAGMVCISAASGAIPEIIDDKENGFLVEKENIDQLAITITNVCNIFLSDKNSCEFNMINRIKNNAYQKAQRFTIKIFSEKLDFLVKNI